MVVSVDAMGGDYAPGVVIRGALQALDNYSDVEVILVGNENVIKNELAKVLYQNDIKKFIIASDSDELTNDLLIQNSEFNLELESFLNSLSESKDMKTVQNMVNDFRKSWKGE